MDKRITIIEYAIFGLVVFIFSFVAGQYFWSATSPTQWLAYSASDENTVEKYRKEFENLGGVVVDNNSKEAKSIPVLTYHGVITDPSETKNNSGEGEDILLSLFKDQMFTLKKNGYNTISVRDFYAFMNGERSLPEKSFLLTFDDGRKDSYYPVDPLLEALDYTAVMYVITSQINDQDAYYLTEREYKDMLESERWELQSHGNLNHEFIQINANGERGAFIPNKFWLEDESRLESDEEHEARIKNDLLSAKKDLEKKFNIDVISYAFPFGDFGDDKKTINTVLSIVKEIYPMSFYQFRNERQTGYYRQNYPIFQDTAFAKRLTRLETYTGDQLIHIFEASKEKSLPYYEYFVNQYAWVAGSSKPNIDYVENDLMILKTLDQQTSVIASLDGTTTWRDYSMSLQARLVHGTKFDLIARNIDGNNNIDCKFTHNRVTLEEFVDEQKTQLQFVDIELDVEKFNSVGILVNGNSVSCIVNNTEVLVDENYNPLLSHGGPAIKAWDAIPANTELWIKNISVEPL